MPRHARIDIPGLLHHVIARGIEKSPIFLDDQDREMFLARLGPLLTETGTDCYAWALLDSHFHLLLQPHATKLATLMRRLLTGYAVVFNLRHNRAGHLFQNRYKSMVCDSDAYLLELVRYIHLNPLRAGIVADLDELDTHPWCGHRQMLGQASRSLITEDPLLSLFSSRRTDARKRYRQFVADGIVSVDNLSRGGKRAGRNDSHEHDDVNFFDGRILGGGEFVARVLTLTGQTGDNPRRTLAEIVDQVASCLGVEASRLGKPGKERDMARAKAVICYVAVREQGLRGIDIAPALAYTPAAVSHAAKRGERILRQEPDMRLILGVNL